MRRARSISMYCCTHWVGQFDASKFQCGRPSAGSKSFDGTAHKIDFYHVQELLVLEQLQLEIAPLRAVGTKCESHIELTPKYSCYFPRLLVPLVVAFHPESAAIYPGEHICISHFNTRKVATDDSNTPSSQHLKRYDPSV
jgi:hypothetical protein